MSLNQVQVDKLIVKYEQFEKKSQFMDYNLVKIIYNYYFNGARNQTTVSIRYFEDIRKKVVKRKKKSFQLPLVNYYTQALVEIGWLSKQYNRKNLNYNGKTRAGTVYFITLEPLYLYFNENIKDNPLTSREKYFLEFFIKSNAINKEITRNNQSIIIGTCSILQKYIIFRKYIELLSEKYPNWKESFFDKQNVSPIYEKIIQSKDSKRKIKQKINDVDLELQRKYFDNIFYEFINIYIYEQQFWSNISNSNIVLNSELENEYSNWWSKIESFLLQNYGNLDQIEDIFRTSDKL